MLSSVWELDALIDGPLGGQGGKLALETSYFYRQ